MSYAKEEMMARRADLIDELEALEDALGLDEDDATGLVTPVYITYVLKTNRGYMTADCRYVRKLNFSEPVDNQVTALDPATAEAIGKRLVREGEIKSFTVEGVGHQVFSKNDQK